MKSVSRIVILLLGSSFIEQYVHARSPSDELVDNLIEKSVNATSSEYVIKTGSVKNFLRDSFDDTLKNIPPNEAVERVRQGMGLTTHIVQYITSRKSTNDHQKYVMDMMGEGLVTVLLNLVNQCGEKSMKDVVETKGIIPFSPRRPIKGKDGIVEGYVYNPQIWLEILVGLVGRAELPIGNKKLFYLKRKIARKIGPLLKTLQDDTKREFFQENEYWHDAYIPSLDLLTRLVGLRGHADYIPEIIPIIIELDGIIEMLIQCIFWGETRPEIIEESHHDIGAQAQIAYYAGGVIEQIMLLGEMDDNPVAVYYTGAGYDINMKICGTMIGTSNTTFPVGILSLLKGGKTNSIMSSKWFLDRPSMWNIMTALGVTGCVTDEIYEGLVAVGNRDDVTFDDASDVVKLGMEMGHLYSADARQKPLDSRMSLAIQEGMFELVLKILVRFKSKADGRSHFIHNIGQFLQAAQSVSQYELCTKAIAQRHDSIAAALKEYDEDQTSPIKSAVVYYNDIGSMVRSMLDLNNPEDDENMKMPCFDCRFEDDEELCQKCNNACLCTNKCKVQHWDPEKMKGSCTEMTMVSIDDVTELQKNLFKIMSKVMEGDTRSQILVDAVIMGLNISDCIAVIDLRTPPLSVYVTDQHRASEKDNDDLIVVVMQRDRENPLSHLHDGDDEVFIQGNTERMADRFFFHTISWPVAHEELKNHFAGRIDELKENPQLGIDFLETVKDDYFRHAFELEVRKKSPEIDEDTLHEVVEILFQDLKAGKFKDPAYNEDNEEKDHDEL